MRAADLPGSLERRSDHDQSAAGIITNKRALESTVLVDDGQIVVLGGLIQDSTADSEDKVPLLGDIPLRRRAVPLRDAQAARKTNLMVFLRPVGRARRRRRGRAHAPTATTTCAASSRSRSRRPCILADHRDAGAAAACRARAARRRRRDAPAPTRRPTARRRRPRRRTHRERHAISRRDTPVRLASLRLRAGEHGVLAASDDGERAGRAGAPERARRRRSPRCAACSACRCAHGASTRRALRASCIARAYASASESPARRRRRARRSDVDLVAPDAGAAGRSRTCSRPTTTRRSSA